MCQGTVIRLPLRHRPCASRRCLRSGGGPGAAVPPPQFGQLRTEDGYRRHRRAARPRAAADPAKPRRHAYTFTPEALRNIPQGENAPLNQVLLQAPGTAQDSFGQIHLRGEHANVQYRLNGVELPEGLSVFGQALTERFAREPVADNRCVARAIWISDRRDRRHPDQNRPHQSWAVKCRCTAAVGTGWSQAWSMAATPVRWITSSRSMGCTTIAALKIPLQP